MKHIKRTSDNYVVETSVVVDTLDTPHFTMEDYVVMPSGDKQDYRALTASKRGHSAGIQIEILKIGKRRQSMSVEMGLKELDIFIKYLQDERSKVRDYAGKHEILVCSE
jgi:hypothetical protein